jgi:hypothetical protein
MMREWEERWRRKVRELEREERRDPLMHDPGFLKVISKIPESELDSEIAGRLALKRLTERAEALKLYTGKYTFYHATPLTRLRRVLREGLSTGAAPVGRRLFGRAEPKYTAKGIYLTLYPEGAMQYARVAYEMAKDEGLRPTRTWALLKVTLPPSTELIPDLKFERAYIAQVGHIPPRYLKHVYTFRADTEEMSR